MSYECVRALQNINEADVETFLLAGGAGVGSTLAVGQSDVDETTGVEEALLGAASDRLNLVLLLGDLRSLSTDTSGVSQRTVDFSHCVVMLRSKGVNALPTAQPRGEIQSG